MWDRVRHALVTADRERAGRPPSPSAAILDSQSVRTTDQKGGAQGDDSGKKIWGRKRRILTDTDGRLLTVHVHGADVQDRDGARGVLQRGPDTRSESPPLQMAAMLDA